MRRRSLGARAAILLCAAAPLVLSADAHAQRGQAVHDGGPHYVGDAVSIRLTAEGFEESPTPEVVVPVPKGGRLELVGVSPSVSQSITIINGQITRQREVTHVFQYRFVPEDSGPVRVGPFRITQGKVTAQAAAVRLDIQPVPATDDVAVRLELPSEELYVGQRVPATITFTIEKGMQKNLLGYELRAPLFDLVEKFRFLDDEQTRGDTKVVVETAAGSLELLGTTEEVTRGGKRYTAVSVTRTLVPLVEGRQALPPATISIEEGVRFRRDFFGGRRATQARRWRARDTAREIVVRSIPGGQRPASFASAVGRGFTLDVQADRTVVQVGDPITLTFTLRGEGLEGASLPPLDAQGLLDPQHFRVPEGDLTGERIGDAKRFVATVRVLDDNVAEIPALEYAWFDTDSQQYETTHSRPIALSVRSAEVIGASDVETETGSGEGDTGDLASASGTDSAPEGGARARSFALTGADLAIVREPHVLLGASSVAVGASWLQVALYGVSLLFVPLALIDRRRRETDPKLRRRRRVVAEELAALRCARTPGEVGHALRRMVAEAPDAADAEIDDLLGECDALSYAPEPSQHALSPELVERALALAERIAGRVG